MLILHLSDLHFGPHSRFAGDSPERLASAFLRQLLQAMHDTGTGDVIDLVCVTGDLTEAARPGELQQAEQFFAALAEQLGVGHCRFVLVPGNHDVSWTACVRVMLEQKDYGFPDEELPERFAAVKLERYLAFVRRFWQPSSLDDVAVPLGSHGPALWGRRPACRAGGGQNRPLLSGSNTPGHARHEEAVIERRDLHSMSETARFSSQNLGTCVSWLILTRHSQQRHHLTGASAHRPCPCSG